MSNADLIARLEKAESGSRELDLEIWGNHVAVPRSPRPWKLNVTPPAYTTSIDAIVALIGAKLGGHYRLDVSEGPKSGVDAVVWRGGAAFFGEGWTAPLALAAALLKALDQNGGEHG